MLGHILISSLNSDRFEESSERKQTHLIISSPIVCMGILWLACGARIICESPQNSDFFEQQSHIFRGFPILTSEIISCWASRYQH